MGPTTLGDRHLRKKNAYVLVDRSLAWLSSEMLYQQLRQMQTLTDNHWTQVRNPYGRVRRQKEGAVGDANPLRRPIISSNPVTWETAEPRLST